MYSTLKNKLAEHNVSYQDLSKLLDLSEAELSARFEGKTAWTLSDVVKICVRLNTPDAELLFLPV